jgi:hypothetical protein
VRRMRRCSSCRSYDCAERDHVCRQAMPAYAFAQCFKTTFICP